MKKILIPVILAVAVGICLAGAEKNMEVIEDTSTTSAKTNTTTHAYSGYLESIYIDIPAASTCTVSVATSQQTLLTATSISADTLYRPRYVAHDAAGGIYQIATNSAVAACLALDKLTFVVTSNAAATNDVYVYITTKE